MRLALIMLGLTAMPASALTLGECRAITHLSHGGVAGHVDYGGGRVGWVSWWSQEGVFTDLTVADCRTGEALTTRVREENISARAPFDRRRVVREIIEREMSGAPAFFSFERLREAIHPRGRDIEIAVLDAEPCACAAAYPELRGDKTPYKVTQ